MSKLWLCFMAGPGSLEDLKELIEPVWKTFDGIVCTYHGSLADEEAAYLESRMKDGKIIYLPYSGRHDFSRNAYLFCGPMQNGDYFVQIDVLERIAPEFARDLHETVKYFKSQWVNMVYFYGKPYIVEFHESLTYVGSPHEGLIRRDGKGVGIELNRIYQDENKVRINVRPIKRTDPFHFVGHYLRYYLLPWGTNQCRLDEKEAALAGVSFDKREQKRNLFRDYLREKQIPLTVDGVKELMKRVLDEKEKDFFNSEKILNDAYRLFQLGRTDFKDDHNWSDMIKV